jgi:hypothetical protein
MAACLVDQLIAALNRAMGGTFRGHVDGVAQEVAERTLMQSGNG